MKLIDLKEVIDFIIQRGDNAQLDVVIPNNGHSMGWTSATNLKRVSVGFDWDSGRIFLIPENEMQEIKDSNK